MNKCLRIFRDCKIFHQLEQHHAGMSRAPDICVPDQLRLSAHAGKEFIGTDSLVTL